MARVLVVEDEPDIASGLRDNLEFEGYEVVTAVDGEEAIKATQEHNPDLILMDLMMPDFDGFYGLKNIRKIDYNAKVVINTDSTEHDEKNRLIEMGVFAIIEKPHGITDLVEMLHKLSIRCFN